MDLGDTPYHWVWHRVMLHVSPHIWPIWHPTNCDNSAKILARIVLEDPHIRSYADIGRKVFGPRSVPVISLLFGLELFTVSCVCIIQWRLAGAHGLDSVALVTLYGDSLHTVIPTYSPDTFKILGLAM